LLRNLWEALFNPLSPKMQFPCSIILPHSVPRSIFIKSPCISLFFQIVDIWTDCLQLSLWSDDYSLADSSPLEMSESYETMPKNMIDYEQFFIFS
jgi:hypothetical protein